MLCGFDDAMKYISGKGMRTFDCLFTRTTIKLLQTSLYFTLSRSHYMTYVFVYVVHMSSSHRRRATLVGTTQGQLKLYSLLRRKRGRRRVSEERG